MKLTGHAFECEIKLLLPDSEEWMNADVKVKTNQFQSVSGAPFKQLNGRR